MLIYNVIDKKNTDQAYPPISPPINLDPIRHIYFVQSFSRMAICPIIDENVINGLEILIESIEKEHMW